jgi:membrane associated rhomboid family serine protease
MGEKNATLVHLLLTANIAVFLLQLYLDPGSGIVQEYVLTAEHIFEQERYEVFITASFLHGGIAHLVNNMIFLYLLGKLCERTYGTVKTGIIYFSAVILGGLSFILLFPQESAVGASAGVFGLATAAMLGAPEKTIFDEVPLLHYFTVPVIRNVFSTVLIATLFLVLPNLLNAFNLAGNVAHIAHIGGMAAGALFAFLWFPEKAKKGFWAFVIFAGFALLLIMSPTEQARQIAIYGIIGFAALLRLFYMLV